MSNSALLFGHSIKHEPVPANEVQILDPTHVRVVCIINFRPLASFAGWNEAFRQCRALDVLIALAWVLCSRYPATRVLCRLANLFRDAHWLNVSVIGTIASP